MIFEREITDTLILTGLEYGQLLAGRVVEDATNIRCVKISDEGKTEFVDSGFLFIEKAVIERLEASKKEELTLEYCKVIIRLV